MGLNILKIAIQAAEPQAARRGEMPPAELRFAIELGAAPDLADLRTRLIVLFQSDGFVLESLFALGGSSLDRFVLLRVVGVERTLPADVLFESAYALASALGAVSVEPDVGSGFFEEAPPPDAGPNTEAAEAVRRWCNVDVAAPLDHLWALQRVSAIEAWKADDHQGAGILVAQPDTGVLPNHPELADMLDMTRAFNVLDPGAPPVDPLVSGMANPGHGTGTASCIASRSSGAVTGSAPKAQVVPIRCINDVKVFDASPVARAIDHARTSGCHVITMSLGGVPSRALHEALKAAVKADLIVLAAAGNCVRFVVWPARYNECIAVAGINVDDLPWKGSCRGSAVDISAPAENVWRATPVSGGSPDFGPGQGTSFAVAVTAGVAALWLAHHGRQNLIAKARAKGGTLQQLFLSALGQTARRPANWDPTEFGRGVVDAAALLALNPDQISIVKKESGTAFPSANEIEELVTELGGAPDLPAGFDWARYGLELANVMMEQSRRESRYRSGAGVESGLRPDRPSATLAKELQGARSPALEAVRAAAGTYPPTVHVLPAVAQSDDHATAAALRVLAATVRKDSREAASRLTREAAQSELRQNGKTLVDRVLADLDESGKRSGEEAEAAKTLHGLIDSHGRTAIMTLANKGTVKSLSTVQRVSTEALVKLTGRPALLVKVGDIDYDDSQIGNWQTSLLMLRNQIPELVKSVGRIEVQGEHVGTGFLIADDLVMTNRHVLEEIAAPLPTRVKQKSWVLAKEGVAIDFLREHGSQQTLRFAVTEVLFSGPTPTNDTEYVDFTDLDMAILRIATTNAAGQKPPPKLPCLKGDLSSHGSKDVIVIGYPAAPVTLPIDAEGHVRQDVIDALMRIYRLRYGVKYLSPGEVSSPLGGLASDTEKWVFGHDCTTLGGNSGSCVIRYGPTPAIIGLHFAGEFERSNYAHGLRRIVEKGDIPADLLKDVNWVQE